MAQQAISNPFETAQQPSAPAQGSANPFETTAQGGPQNVWDQQYGTKQLPNGTISAGPGGVLGWLHDLEGDLRNGTGSTAVGRFLSSVGAQPIGHTTAGDQVESVPLGLIHTAAGLVAMPQHPVHGAVAAGKGALETLTIPAAFAAPESDAIAEAAPGVVQKAANAIKSVTPQSVQDAAAEAQQVARPVTDALSSAGSWIKQQAQKLYVPQAAKDARAAGQDAGTIANAERPIGDINQSALPKLQTRVGKVLDDTNKAIGLDTTGEASLTRKMAQGAETYKSSAQELYQQADAIAAKATGQSGNFQRLGQAVEDAKVYLQNPALTNDEKVAGMERLTNAQTDFDKFMTEAKAAGVNVESLVAEANRKYSTGLSLEEFGRQVLKGENVAGQLIPNARPLNNAVKQVTADVATRGHVLGNAVGEQGAGEIKSAVNDAEQSIQALRKQKAQAMSTVRAGKRAETQIAQTRKRQLIGATALGVPSAGYAGYALLGKKAPSH
jgi:hypothetical protein